MSQTSIKSFFVSVDRAQYMSDVGTDVVRSETAVRNPLVKAKLPVKRRQQLSSQQKTPVASRRCVPQDTWQRMSLAEHAVAVQRSPQKRVAPKRRFVQLQPDVRIDAPVSASSADRTDASNTLPPPKRRRISLLVGAPNNNSSSRSGVTADIPFLPSSSSLSLSPNKNKSHGNIVPASPDVAVQRRETVFDRLLAALPPHIDLLWQNGKRLSAKVVQYDAFCIKRPPVRSIDVAQRCLFRQRVMDEVWNDKLITHPVMVMCERASDGNPLPQSLTLCYYHVAPNAQSFGQWIAQIKAHKLLFDENLLQKAQRVILHIMCRFVLGIDDSKGSATLSHVLVGRSGDLHAISLSDDGRRELSVPSSSVDGAPHSVALLLQSTRWNAEARSALKIVCGGMSRDNMLFLLRRLDSSENWRQFRFIARQHDVSKQRYRAARMRMYCLIEALQACRIE